MSNSNVDDDGRPMRTGTWVTGSAHIITAVIGSGVLTLAWAIGQLGWIAGPTVLIAFSIITLLTSSLLADAYRHPHPVTGPARSYTYMDAVRAQLGGHNVQLCGLAQCANLVGVNVGYTITAAISMAAVQSSWSCFHHGKDKCHVSSTRYSIIYGCAQLVLSQVRDFQKLSWISVLAALMSVTYSVIGAKISDGVLRQRRVAVPVELPVRGGGGRDMGQWGGLREAVQAPVPQRGGGRVVPARPDDSDFLEDKSTAVSVGAGGVNVDTAKGKPPGGTTVNVGKGSGVNGNTGKGTHVTVGGKGGVGVNTGKPGSRTNVGVGKGGVAVNAGK